MLKKPFVLLLALVLSLGVAACKSEKSNVEQQEAQEKQWREQQRQKAARYYNELVEKYPDSPFAEKARERLQAMGPVAGKGSASK